MKRAIFGLLAGLTLGSALASLGVSQAAAQRYRAPITLVARSMEMTPSGCRVTFVLRNRSTMRIQGARFWLRAADGNLETFWISDHRPATQETFEWSHCNAIRANLYLVRARCNFRGIFLRRNCMSLVRLVAGPRLRGAGRGAVRGQVRPNYRRHRRPGNYWRRGHPRY